MLYIVIPIAIIIILILIYFEKPKRYLKTSEIRGIRGENKVKYIIGETIENEQYIINDLIIANNESSTQIDHIVINTRGIFVIETKNYSGNIFGSENDQQWTQVLSHGKVKQKFYNPLKQNATHVYNVRKLVGQLPIRSLVVFVQNNTRNINANNVIPLLELKQTLQNGENVLSAQQMKTAYDLLLASKVIITTQEHIHNIKEKQHNLDLNICPRCGKQLVVRNSKYGKFLGCSNYPKCKFKKNI